MLLILCLQNVKHISHVVQIKTTKTIRMGWHCTVVCQCLTPTTGYIGLELLSSSQYSECKKIMLDEKHRNPNE